MKLLVACGSCGRQYDASDRKVGSRFRCHCGDVVRVEEPRPHEAKVVRCGACGAPRAGQAETCSYCGSDFTLHERDLDTVCPRCFARISSSARFCVECGLAMQQDVESVGELTQRICPVCPDVPLRSRRLGHLEGTVLECGRCAGLWLGADTFARVERQARETQSTGVAGQTTGAPARVEQKGPLYRPCPICGKLMHRQNYGKRSGVIVDVCREHGVWFDDQELQGILGWIRDGGLERSEQRDVETRRESERRERFELPPMDGMLDADDAWSRSPAGDLLVDLAGALGRAVFRGRVRF
ncbi:MAG: zinc ribbon domain-containing protein [Acidobacteriota bacterium]